MKFMVFALALAVVGFEDEPAEGPEALCLARVRDVHGATGPWAVAGYRMGERALKELGQERHSHDVFVVHHAPLEVSYTCVADGWQAATGASAGKLNLRIEPALARDLKTEVIDRKSGRRLVFTLQPEFMRSLHDVPFDRLEAEGRRVATLKDDAIFQWAEATSP